MPLNVELLRKVQAVIREEPRRLFMDAWYLDEPESVLDPEDIPPCGTICCIGGWGRFLTHPNERLNNWNSLWWFENRYVNLFLFYPFSEEMQEDVHDLLRSYPSADENEEGRGPWEGEVVADAAAACRAIDRLIEKWEPKEIADAIQGLQENEK